MHVRDRLIKYLTNVYSDGADLIIAELENQKIFNDDKEPSLSNLEDPLWYRDTILYAIYPDAITYNSRNSPLNNVTEHLERVKSLGCNAIHILPFLASPMKDAGFDVSDYYAIRDGLGELKDLKELVKTAQSLSLAVFMDIVFNHVSSEHEWFKKARAGDKKYQDYFIHTNIQPEFIEKYFRNSAIWAKYKVDGHYRNISIAFPEHTGPIPHWNKCDDNWYYHTYYPHQLDVNWSNPNIFIEYAKIIIYWARIGFNFRLDAIPFVGQGPYKKTDLLNPTASYILASLKLIVAQINPGCLFLSESYERPKKIISYFGKTALQQADLAYQFHLCTSIWVSLATHDIKHIWKSLHLFKQIPKHAQWLDFLRNHDELSLAYLKDQDLETVRKKFAKNGKNFREECGISGRTFSLLGKNKEAFVMAYFLLSIMPGAIMLPYGDEIAKTNDPISKLPHSLREDTRNINRGKIHKNDYKTPLAKFCFNQLQRIFQMRKKFAKYFHSFPERIATPANILGIKYTLNEKQSISIYINLSHKIHYIDLPQQSSIEFIVNKVEVTDTKVKLDDYSGIWLSTSTI